MKHLHIPTNGITIHAVELGEGPPVVFCHGFPDTWRGWRRQMEAVAAAGFRAIALDMRGYGESSAPSDAAVYTSLHTVGDLVGILEALQISSAVLVGHDFGAVTVCDAGLMRPDLFVAVFIISIPFVPRGDKSILQRYRDAGHADLYMFDRMPPEADDEWADASAVIPANLYWSSAAAPASERWTLFNRGLPKYRTLPEPLPAWADASDIAYEIGEFQRTGFHGALNHYRALELSFELLAPFKGRRLEQPAFFLGGQEDNLVRMAGDTSEEHMRKTLPGLLGNRIVPGVGHWPQLEAADATNESLVTFLRSVAHRCNQARRL